MPQIEREIVDRALRWCAESGRPVREEIVRQVLEPLGWDELLAVKAVLADPPPARDLSPADLVLLSRGGPPRAAAPEAPASPPAGTRKPRGAKAARPPPGPRIRRARDRVEAPSPAPAALPRLDELFRESGRAVLERMVRRRGASRAALVADLSAGWSAGSGTPGSGDLDRLLAHHRMARGFQERERALLVHALRKHGGVLVRVARDLGATPEEVREAVGRLGIAAQMETIREARRRALERKVTLSERARLVDEEEEALSDLGLLPRLEADLRRRLPEQLRALSGGGRPPTAIDLGRSLSLSRGAVDRLAARFSLPLRAAPAERPDRPGGRRDRPFSPRGAAPRAPSSRPPGGRPPAGRSPARRRPRS
jgi:hypothetical protein